MIYSKELVAASTVPIILSILRGGRSYGYLVIKKVKELSGGELQWSEAMLYPVLKRMERDGLVKSSWVVAEGGRKRKYYDITEMGQEVLRQKQAEWFRMTSVFSKLWSLNS